MYFRVLVLEFAGLGENQEEGNNGNHAGEDEGFAKFKLLLCHSLLHSLSWTAFPWEGAQHFSSASRTLNTLMSEDSSRPAEACSSL